MGLFRRKDPKPKSIFGGNVGGGYGSEPSSSGIDPKRLAAGLLAQGEVLTVGQGDASWTDGPGGLPAPWTHLTVRVRLEGVPPYEATRLQSIPGMRLNQVQTPGAIVAVRVNPNNHDDIAVDFNTDPPNVPAG